MTVAVQRIDSPVADQRVADPEHLLAEVLADVLDVERVSVTANFFADLGADSLGMAHFCARLTKRPDLPSVSIKEVYENPTIRDLATSVSEAAPPSVPVPRLATPVLPADAAPVGRWQFMLCGAMQFLALFQFAALAAFVAARGYDWVSAASGLADVYLRSAIYGGGVFVGWASLGIVAKWALIGRWKPEQFRIWSFRYLGFWFVKVLVQSNPLVLFVGTPIYALYLRALGAKIGRNVVILSRSAPVCADLLTIGGNTVVRKDSSITCYRAQAGLIQVGPVTLGADAFVGEATVLDIHTSVGDGAQLGHASALLAGESVPDGECWVGSPARQRTEVDYRALAPANRSALRRATYSIMQLLVLFAVTLPLPIGIALLLAESRISPAGLLTSGSQPFTSWAFFAEALIFSLVLFVLLTIVRLAVVLTVPRILNRAIKPNVTYPLYGLRYWAHRAIARFSNVSFFTILFGDTSFIVHYLYLLGYKVSFAEQTGANFGLNVKHDNPHHVHVGAGTMAADGLSIINADYSSTSFRVSPVTIGAHSFIGNNVAYPSQAKTGENCLLGSKVMVPVEGDQRENAGFLGSPSFEIPRLVLRDQRFDDMKRGDELTRRLAAKNRHNVISICLFLLTRWVALFGAALLALGAADLYTQFGAVVIVAVSMLATVFGTLYNVLIERASTRFKPLRPMYCSIYDRESWKIERFWKLSWQPALLNGTPLKGFLWRLLGVRVGKRLFDDGALMVEKTMITVGDNCAFNTASVIQPHSQEDGTFKSDYVTIGDGCTLGIASLVHYGVSMGDEATLAPNSFLMKGTEVPPQTYWGENPARELSTTGPAQAPQETDSEQTTDVPNLPAPGDTGTTTGGSEPMKTEAGTDREYWRGVLRGGGLTAIPRWTPDSAIDECAQPIPDDLAKALRGLADELDVSFTSVLLAAHAKVLAVLSGEQEVTTGYVAEGDDVVLPCRLTTEACSWRALLLESDRVEAELLAHGSTAIGDLKRELGLTEPPFETEFDPIGTDSPLGADTVLRVGFVQTGDKDILRVHYRNNVLDQAAAARTAGYHLTALTLIAADVEAEHRRQSLLSDDELEFQLEELAGPTRELPDHRFHELFEQRVAAHPDAVAAVHRHRPWTYRELNSRANKLARALLARGLRPEGVVAVVTERNLDWMAAVLAVFKAGGVYLPIEPHFPADRIATTLARAECRFVLTEPGTTETLATALDSLSGVQTLEVGTAYDEDHLDGDLGVDVGADQLAYIYFTSGSTGEPKGAMCEHAGLLNHLYAKIDDLQIDEGQTVAQIAPQCFDISLWQLVSALLVGGRTLIVEQETILDPERFIDTIVDGRVAVAQVVPSYLEVLLSYLEQDARSLPELHCVSVTGEALTLELTQRWFAAKPGIKLANAYGLTETSDDTNHEVMDQAPSRGGVPLGRAVNNVEVRVVDEHLSPVPLGAPGEIVFSGICVGRGYINDPERTRLAYMADPLRQGQRLYRSGDFGRWRPDGKLEFLGRRDAQVKIRGFRIEIGEIENALQRAPGVRIGAVVVTEGPDQGKKLVGFYSGQQLEADALRDRLGRSLPDYMVPTAFHWRERLPLTDNGKIDRKTLIALAGDLDLGSHDFQAPNTAPERRLAAAWAEVLGVAPDQIGRHDDFFDKGGTSLSAVKLVIALEGVVSLKDVTRNPVLADLALLLDGGGAQPAGLLQLLSDSDGAESGALVCFPYAGGNAINFQAMARELRSSGLAVYAVELPGHDVANEGEPFVSMNEVVEQVVAEIIERRLTPIMLWGHSSGAAFAVEAARQLHDRDVDVQRVIVAAQLLGDPADRRAHIAELDQRSDSQIAARLAEAGGYTELGELNGQHADRVGAAYRHDCVAAHRYLLEALDTPPANKLPVPVTVVAAADDPATADWSDRHGDWQLLAEPVDVYELADGGHYFLRTRPTEAAEVVRRLAGSPAADAGGEVAEGLETSTSTSTSTSRSTSNSSSTSPLDVDRQPGKPPMLTVDAGDDTQSWIAQHRNALRAVVAEHGALHVRGLDLRDATEVGSVAKELATDLVTEREAFASREVHAGGIYSSSEWPPNQQMCMHHELSYKLEFPGLMLFACLVAPSAGGAIALADSPTVLDSLPADVAERFGREGWMLTRNYTDEIGLSVAQAFGTDDRKAVEKYCRANKIEFEWLTDGGLRTRQHRSAIVQHPITGQRCWFNQIAFLNEWTMNPEVREFLVDFYGADGLPFNTLFGNGDPISGEVVQAINETYEANTASEPLQAGDLILVDNVRTAHSRQPFEGERTVLVAMGDGVRLADVSPAIEVSDG